jgi:hypothetical protein
MSMPSEAFHVSAELTSTVVALVALILTFRAERRNQARFEKEQQGLAMRFQREQERSTRVANANVLPCLATEISHYYGHSVGLELWNHGVGVAVIRKITIHRGKLTGEIVPDVLELSRDLEYWSDFLRPGDQTSYLRPQTKEMLVELTEERLVEDGISRREVPSLLEEVAEQLEDVSIVVTYEDVFGNTIAKNVHL